MVEEISCFRLWTMTTRWRRRKKNIVDYPSERFVTTIRKLIAFFASSVRSLDLRDVIRVSWFMIRHSSLTLESSLTRLWRKYPRLNAHLIDRVDLISWITENTERPWRSWLDEIAFLYFATNLNKWASRCSLNTRHVSHVLPYKKDRNVVLTLRISELILVFTLFINNEARVENNAIAMGLSIEKLILLLTHSLKLNEKKWQAMRKNRDRGRTMTKNFLWRMNDDKQALHHVTAPWDQHVSLSGACDAAEER